MHSNENKLKAILDSTNDNIVLMDPSYKVLCFNEAIKKTLFNYFGKNIREGDDYRDFVIPPLKKLFLDSFQKALLGEVVVVEEETRVETFSLWFQYKVNPVYDKNNQLIGVALTASNIDPRKRMEIALQQSEEKFRKIIESAANPIIIVDQQMQIKMINPETSVVFGYSSDELIDKNISILIPERFQENHTEHQENYLKNGNPVRMGVNRGTPARKKDGSEIIIEASLNTFDVGDEKYVLVIIQDVTERARFEQSLKKVNQELLLLNKVSDMILVSKDEQMVYDELCKIIVEYGSYKLAWISAKPDSIEDQLLKPIAAYGQMDYLKELKISLLDNVQSKGPSATALRFGKIVITKNVVASEEFKPWLEIAQKYGIRSSAVLPIKFDQKIHGCLNVYSEDIDAFDKEEVLVLERIVKNVSLAINSLLINKEKEKVRYNLNERIKELRTIYLVTSILQEEEEDNSILLQNVVNVLPEGWQYPDICSAKIVYDAIECSTLHFQASEISQHVDFKTLDGKKGYIEIVYNTKSANDVSFLREEWDLITTLSEMLSVYFNKKAILSELKKSEANLASVFENTDVGHLLLDNKFNVLAFNQRFYNGYAQVSGIRMKKGANISSMLMDDKKERVIDIYRKVAETGQPILYESVYEQAGIKYFFNINVSPVLDTKTLIGYAISIVDITERKNQEIERQNMIVDLTQKNRDLEQFAYIVSHNVRSPLATILGMINLLDMAKNKKGRDEILMGLRKSAQNLDVVLTDLNDILQIRKSISEKKVDVDLGLLVEQIKEAIDPMIKEKKLEINYRFDEVGSLFTIKSFIYNIFYNLISNSIKYSKPEAFPRIDIWSEKLGNHAVLHFSDNGIGIDLEKYGEQIFGLYKKFNLSVEGKGLGLFMVKTQIEALGGSVSVESQLGKGSHFKITL